MSSEVELIRSWRKSPEKFIREVFKVDKIEDWQLEVLRAFPTEKKIAIKSGHGVGKTTLLSWLILHYIVCYAPAKVPCTAPTGHQLEDVLWAEIRKWVSRAPEFIQVGLHLTRDKLSSSADTFAVARTARKDNPDAFQGFHDENLLFIIDEASGVDDLIFEVAKGALSTKGARVIMTGNPTKTSGYFFNAFNINREVWWTKTVSCFDSSRVDKDFIQDCIREYGEDSNFFRVRVLGEFPESSDMQFISSDKVKACLEFKCELWEYKNYKPILGVDVARFGDDSTIIISRQGRKINEPLVIKQQDLMQVVGHVVNEIKKCQPIKVVIDSIGIGAGVVDRLKELGYGDMIIGCNSSERPSSDKFINKRGEMWDNMRTAIYAGLELPNINRMVDDLTGIEYGFNSKGQLVLEKKENMKKRGLPSPDYADALALTYAYSFNNIDDVFSRQKGINNIKFAKGESLMQGIW